MDEQITPFEEVVHTHKAIITIISNEDTPEVRVKVSWEPDLDGKSITEIGYIPAAYDFVQEYMLPAIEQAFMDWESDPMMLADSPSKRIN